MSNDIISREQRIRKEVELQSLYGALANFRGREASYIEDSAAIPEVLINQINETRRDIERVEHDLFGLTDKTSEARSRSMYRQAFESELAGDLSKAIKRYRSAGRYGHADASAAIRSLRYRMKRAKNRAVAAVRIPISGSKPRNRALSGLAAFLLVILVITFILNSRSPEEVQPAIGTAPDAPVTPSPIVQIIIPATATPPPAETDTPTNTPVPTSTPQPTPPELLPTETLPPTPISTPILRPAPRIIEPKDGLVWGDGAIVFEFVDLDLAHDELYCLNTMRGYDLNKTENWSHEPRGSKRPFIAVEPNVFRVAKAQGMSCIVWSAYIGRETCEHAVSESTQERIIGLPRPCAFD